VKSPVRFLRARPNHFFTKDHKTKNPQAKPEGLELISFLIIFLC